MKGRRVIVFTGLLGVSTAVAAFCCDPWGLPIQQLFVTIGQSIAGLVKTSASTLQTVSSTGPEATFAEGVGKTIIELQKGPAQSMVGAQGVVAARQSLEAQAVVAHATEQALPATLIETTVTNAALSNEMTPIVADKIQTYDHDWSNSYLSKTPADIGHTVIQRHQPYCTALDVEDGLCDKVASPTMQGADVTVNTILYPGNGQYETLSDEEHDAALAFVQNLTQPAPYSPPVNASEAAQRELTRQLAADQAAMSLVANSFHTQIAERTRRHQ